MPIGTETNWVSREQQRKRAHNDALLNERFNGFFQRQIWNEHRFCQWLPSGRIELRTEREFRKNRTHGDKQTTQARKQEYLSVAAQMGDNPLAVIRNTTQ
jgi:hypothetical protein